MKTPKLSSNILIMILILGVVAAFLGPMICQGVLEGFDQDKVVDRVSIEEARGGDKTHAESSSGGCQTDKDCPGSYCLSNPPHQPPYSCHGGRAPSTPAQAPVLASTPKANKKYDPELAQQELARARGVLPRDDSNVTTDPLALDEGGRPSSRKSPERCFDGPPSDVFGNCKPLCNAQSLVDSDGMVKQLSDIMGCPEKDRSNTHMLCPSYDECTSGPWYKTLIPKSDRSLPTPADSGTKPSTPDPGSINIPGRDQDDSWTGDSTYPSRPYFHGGTHHHHYDGGEHRKWQREVAPASPHLPTSVHGQQSLTSQMSSIYPDTGTQCSQSVTGTFSDCGPAAANIPCYELFNN